MGETALLVAGLAISAATAATSAAASYEQAQQQNKAASKAKKSALAAAEANAKQVRTGEAVETARQRQQANRVRAMLRVRAAEQGAGLEDGTFAALDRQNDVDMAFNRNITSMNASNQVRSIASGADARLADLESRQTNALLNAFLGGMSGVGTGLSIYSSANSIGAFDSFKKPGATPA